MQHKFKLTNEVMAFEVVDVHVVVHIVDLHFELLSLFESVFNLETFDETRVQGVLDHFTLANLNPFLTNKY